MFYINDEPLTEVNFPQEFKFKEEKFTEIRKRLHIPAGQKLYKFRDPAPTRFGNNGTKEPRKNIDIPMSASKDGVRWTWCKSSTINKNKQRVYNPTGVIFHEKESLDPDKQEDVERIFFYLYISGVIRNRIELENLEKEAKKKNEKEEVEVTVRFYIQSKHSPLSPESNDGSEEKLRTIAYSWQVPNADKEPLEILKRKIIDAVELGEKRKSETGRGYEEFIREANDVSVIQLKADIQKAVDLKIIELSDNRWRYVATGELIQVVIPEYYKKAIYPLELRITRDPEVNKRFYEQLNAYKDYVEPEKNKEEPRNELKAIFQTKERIKNMQWLELKKFANSELKLGISSKSPREEYEVKVIEKLGLV